MKLVPKWQSGTKQFEQREIVGARLGNRDSHTVSLVTFLSSRLAAEGTRKPPTHLRGGRFEWSGLSRIPSRYFSRGRFWLHFLGAALANLFQTLHS
jgi:hypothetical protein